MMSLLFFAFVGLLALAALQAGGKTTGPMPPETGGARAQRRLPIIPLGWSLSLFLGVTYLLCVGFDLIFPAYAMNGSWAALLPGFVWLTPISFMIGLGESLLYGWYVALVFGGLYNVFAKGGRP